MGKLTEEMKRELLEDAASYGRRKDFQRLSDSASRVVLTPLEYVEFLNWTQEFFPEDQRERGPITGDNWLL